MNKTDTELAKTNWRTWISQIQDPIQRGILVEVLMEDGTLVPAHKNGHGKMPTDPAIKDLLVVREPTADLYVKSPPPYTDIHKLLPLLRKIGFKKAMNLLVKGPKGGGKSLSVHTFAAETTSPLVQMECHEGIKDTALFGSFFLRGKETGFVLGKLPTAIDVANEVGRCILDLEELNALPPGAQKSLNAILDFRCAVTLPQIGRTYKLEAGKQLFIVGTMNPSIYGGTYDLNEDLKSRFEEVEVGYPPTGEEKAMLKAATSTKLPDATIDLVLRFAKETRQAATGYALSSRDLVRFLFTIETLGLQEAVQLMVCKFEGDDRETVIKSAERVFPNIKLQKTWGAIG